MTDTNDARPIGMNPIADAASATAPSNAANDTTYPIDDSSDVSSNADLRVSEDDLEDAAMSPTGADIDNDHADERPIDRSQNAPMPYDDDEDEDLDEDQDDEDEEDEQYTPVE